MTTHERMFKLDKCSTIIIAVLGLHAFISTSNFDCQKTNWHRTVLANRSHRRIEIITPKRKPNIGYLFIIHWRSSSNNPRSLKPFSSGAEAVLTAGWRSGRNLTAPVKIRSANGYCYLPVLPYRCCKEMKMTLAPCASQWKSVRVDSILDDRSLRSFSKKKTSVGATFAISQKSAEFCTWFGWLVVCVDRMRASRFSRQIQCQTFPCFRRTLLWSSFDLHFQLRKVEDWTEFLLYAVGVRQWQRMELLFLEAFEIHKEPWFEFMAQ